DVNLGTGELNGKIDRILVREGERVEKGQTVAVLQNGDIQASVQSAEQGLRVAQSRLEEVASGARKEEILAAAAVLEGATADRDEARQQLERYQALRSQGMVSQASLDERQRLFLAAQAKAEVARQQKKLLDAGPRPETVALYRKQVGLARAELDTARQRLDKTLIRSPIAGTVIQRYLDDGEGVTPETPIMAIANLDKVWVNAEIDETDIGRIHLGDPVEITSEAYRGRIFPGRVQQIGDYSGARKISPSNPAVNLGLKVVRVKIAFLETSPFKLGMAVDVRVRPRTR
ncbi:MAG TPA: efflux RND transporter periplasmic adaptor subunit, partial [Thiobacillus sp.]